MSSIIEKTIKILQDKCFPKQQFYLLLASFIIYFKQPLKDEKWNTFPSKIQNGVISLEDGIFMLDEEKISEFFNNPKILKKHKLELKEKIFHIMISTKRRLELNYPNLYCNSCNVVCIPDIIHSYEQPTFFPREYIENQIKNENYVNELTGHKFSWDMVNSIKNNTYSFPIEDKKKIDFDELVKCVEREISHLNKFSKHCNICKRRSTEFKSIKNYQMVYFCSLDCMEKWEI